VPGRAAVSCSDLDHLGRSVGCPERSRSRHRKRRSEDDRNYLTFDSPDSATSAISALKTEGFEAQAYPASACVVVRIWQRDGALIGPVRAALEPLATAHGGRYDGGETVTGDIWGPR
jgi:hypothetical protein